MANVIFFNTLNTTISNFLLIALLFTYTLATTIDIQNLCPYLCWVSHTGGGRHLDYGQAWEINPPCTTQSRIWGRTNCTFDELGRKCRPVIAMDSSKGQSYGAPLTRRRIRTNPIQQPRLL
ncbi:hypothetical protein LOK49_LG13G01264 [Camellia lanceoleosa]|uniref:Uncharacterized protein n=1 Tax=Camellia lanceoleosa TaxID=1840588 RepID=A0ACC0FJW0_9ERIC|nr:hypothetical protein LOK49_LG13G01264 [Camellia lanceoleosa]